MKFDNAGIGHCSREQYTYYWWENLFNTAAKNISVDSDNNGVSVKVIDEDMVDITTKKTSLKALKKHNKLHYNNFLKTSTLLNDGKVIKDNNDDLTILDELEKKIDYTQLTDEDLFKACGGRTAHKGARHGLNLNGKLARIAEQERQLLSKMNLDKAKDLTVDGFEIVKLRKRTKSKRKNAKDIEETVDCSIMQPSCSYGIDQNTKETVPNVLRSKLKVKRKKNINSNLTNSFEKLNLATNPITSENYRKEFDVTKSNESMLDGNANAVEKDDETEILSITGEARQRTKSKKKRKRERKMINALTEQLDATCTIDESTEASNKRRRVESQKIVEDILSNALEMCDTTKKSKKLKKEKNNASEACEFHKLNRRISKKKKYTYLAKQKDKLERITKDLMSVALDESPVKEVFKNKKKKKQHLKPGDEVL